MIVFELSGGLGNQMFQYAAAYALASRLKTTCGADLRAFDENPRPYELEVFLRSPNPAPPDLLPPVGGPWRSRVIRLCSRLGFHDARRFVERSVFRYDIRFECLTDPIYLMGYYQSEKYFAGISDEIRRLYEFRSRPSVRNAELLARIATDNSVSVHVRRGDYISNPEANRFHGTCEPDYYARAIALVEERLETAEFFVFSDDAEWAKANLSFPGPVTFVDHNVGKDSWEDMRLMSHCRHHVIANSSFSWWGAWLDPRAGKLVIAPTQWVRDASIDTRDVVPREWLQC